jgi:GNAT superfamily N-acetyltransferase
MYFAPLTPERWPDLLTLFGRNSACGGCWCQTWRLPMSEFELGKAGKNRRTMKELVTRGPAPGVLGYHKGDVFGWCAIGPREQFRTLEHSRVLRVVDHRPVWCITCLFIARPWRGQGLTQVLVRAALEYARDSGVGLVEAYPMDPADRQQDAFVWTGVASAFRAAGFEEVARRAPRRPIMRFDTSRLPPSTTSTPTPTLSAHVPEVPPAAPKPPSSASN